MAGYGGREMTEEREGEREWVSKRKSGWPQLHSLLTKLNCWSSTTTSVPSKQNVMALTSWGEKEPWWGDVHVMGAWLPLIELTPTAEPAGNWLRLDKDSCCCCWLFEKAEPWERLVDSAPHMGWEKEGGREGGREGRGDNRVRNRESGYTILNEHTNIP